MTQRLTEAILGKDIAFAQGRQNAMLDLRYGGQMGYAPQLNQIISNQPYISRPLIALLIEAPLGFNDLPNKEYWIESLRSLVELRALKITGLASSIEVVTEETSPVGGAGEMHQDFTNVTRERSNPQFTWQEMYGLPVKAFLEGWVTNLMMDPNSKVANVATLVEAGARPNAMLADYYGMTVAFIEPDPTHTKVVRAWLCTNMFPTGRLATAEGTRDLTQAGQALQYDITFTAITQVGLGVEYYCQQLLDNINILGANPMARKAFTQYDTNNGGIGEGTLVEARLQDAGFGYKELTEGLPNNNVQLG
jgi:hypothetical protein